MTQAEEGFDIGSSDDSDDEDDDDNGEDNDMSSDNEGNAAAAITFPSTPSMDPKDCSSSEAVIKKEENVGCEMKPMDAGGSDQQDTKLGEWSIPRREISGTKCHWQSLLALFGAENN